jgi:hypothetical protein
MLTDRVKTTSCKLIPEMTLEAKVPFTTTMHLDSSKAPTARSFINESTKASFLRLAAAEKKEARLRAKRLSVVNQWAAKLIGSSERRYRLREKNRVKGLHTENTLLKEENFSLKQENQTLRLKLELAEAENKRNLLIQENEKKKALEKIRVLQERLQQRQVREELSTPRMKTVPPPSATTVSALLQLKGQSPMPEMALSPPSGPPELRRRVEYPATVLDDNSGPTFSRLDSMVGSNPTPPYSARSELANGLGT